MRRSDDDHRDAGGEDYGLGEPWIHFAKWLERWGVGALNRLGLGIRLPVSIGVEQFGNENAFDAHSFVVGVFDG